MSSAVRRVASSGLSLLALVGLAAAWAAPRVPLNPNSLQARLARVPSTRAAMIGRINGSPALRQAVLNAAGALHLDGVKMLSSTTGSGTTPSASTAPAYAPPTCDFSAGVALSFLQPLAAAGWPPTAWAGLDSGGDIVGPIPEQAVGRPDLGSVAGYMFGLNGVSRLYNANARPEATIWLHPTQPTVPALYVIEFNLLPSWGNDATPTDFQVSAQPLSDPNGPSALVGSTVLGPVLDVIVKIDKPLSNASDCYLVRVDGPQPIWSFGVVTIRTL